DKIVSGDGPAAGDISSKFSGSLPLAPGDSIQVVVSPFTHCVDTTDEVTVTCASAGGSHTETARATVHVLNINIVCDLQLCATFTDQGTQCGTQLQFPDSGPVELNLKLTNTGTSPLDVTSISGLPTSQLVDCGDQTT